MQVSRHAGDAPRQNLSAFGDELAKEIRVLVIQRFNCDIDTTPRHRAIGATEVRSAFSGLRFHGAILLPDARYGVGGVDYIFSFPTGLGY
jgi:hypothetical protein